MCRRGVPVRGHWMGAQRGVYEGGAFSESVGFSEPPVGWSNALDRPPLLPQREPALFPTSHPPTHVAAECLPNRETSGAEPFEGRTSFPSCGDYLCGSNCGLLRGFREASLEAVGRTPKLGLKPQHNRLLERKTVSRPSRPSVISALRSGAPGWTARGRGCLCHRRQCPLTAIHTPKGRRRAPTQSEAPGSCLGPAIPGLSPCPSPWHVLLLGFQLLREVRRPRSLRGQRNLPTWGQGLRVSPWPSPSQPSVRR